MNTIEQNTSARTGGVEVNRICFVYTRKCNLGCDHCFLECSPVNTKKLNPKSVSQCIDEASDLGIKSISFTGGECFLYFDEIKELVNQAHVNGQQTRIVTNGTWANSKEETASKISRLKDAGLDELHVSYGVFHARAGAQLVHIKRIIAECQNVGMPVDIRRIQKWLSYDDDKTLTRELKNLKCKVTILPLMRFGSARKNFGEEVRFVKAPVCEQPRCNNIGVLTYMENGDIFPCCSPALYDFRKIDNCDHLKLGNIYKNTLKESLGKAQPSMFLSILAVTGPNGFRILSEENANNIIWPDKLTNICEFCQWATQNTEFNQWFSSLDEDDIFPRLKNFQEVMGKWGLVEKQVQL